MEGEVWIGVAVAKEYRLILSFLIDSLEPSLAAPLVDWAEERLRKGSWPIWVRDGMDAYGEALKGRHCILKIYPPNKEKRTASPRQTRSLP